MSRARRYRPRDIQQSPFSNLSVTSPTSQLILQPFRRFTYVTAHSPTLPLLHLRHSSFSNPSFASPTSQALHLIHLASRPCHPFYWNEGLHCTNLSNAPPLQCDLYCRCLNLETCPGWTKVCVHETKVLFTVQQSAYINYLVVFFYECKRWRRQWHHSVIECEQDFLRYL